VTAYVIRRLLWTIPLLIGVSVICFTLLKRAPGDPVSAILASSRGSGQSFTAAEREQMREEAGLNDPAYVQYFRWLSEVSKGNMGLSTRSNEPVTEVIRQRLPNTVKLSAVALVLTLSIALPLGIISAVRQYSKLDYSLTFFSFAGISVPQFWLAIMLLYIFAVKLQWLPPFGMQSADVEDGFWPQFVDSVEHYILPVIALTLVGLAGYMRFQRAAMLDVVRQDYIRTARAKGLSERVVILKHAWRNALIPIITLLGYVFVILVEGAVVVENIFSWPGMGQLAVTSLTNRDYPVVMGIVLLSSVLILLGTLLSDILYAVVDPRVRYD
jgi:peptide/nickel transport system permease protein